MKTRKLFLAVVSIMVSTAAVAQSYGWHPEDENYAESCTSIMVGKKASTDGSVMTAHSCDSNYRTWLTMEGSKTYQPGQMQPIYLGLLHTEEPDDMRNVEKKGEIPAPTQPTYRFLNVAYPCMNEKQLAIGETTTTGRLELRRMDGMFMIEELERIALERCATAREAIALIGALAEEYGYLDEGECLTIADKKEVWHFEIYGNGTLPVDPKAKKSKKTPADKPGAMWVAQRIPDDHVGVSANIPRIAVVDFNDPDNFMTSTGLRERAKALGLWSGEGDFVFYKVVSSEAKPFSYREFYVLSTMAPSLGLTFDMAELPFSVKPDKKVSPEDLFAYYRSTYEGTEFDQLKNLSVEVDRKKKENGKTIYYKEVVYPVSTFMSGDMRALLNKLQPGVTPRMRHIAAIQCSYSHIMQCRDWLPDEIGGVAYFSFDNPAQTPRIPIYAGATQLPEGWDVCGQARYRKDAAIWAYRETNRIATIYWGKTRHLLEPRIMYWQEQMMQECELVEKKAAKLLEEGKKEEAAALLNNTAQKFASATAKNWEDIKAELWPIFARGL
jgi:dipeptidase